MFCILTSWHFFSRYLKESDVKRQRIFATQNKRAFVDCLPAHELVEVREMLKFVVVLSWVSDAIASYPETARGKENRRQGVRPYFCRGQFSLSS